LSDGFLKGKKWGTRSTFPGGRRKRRHRDGGHPLKLITKKGRKGSGTVLNQTLTKERTAVREAQRGGPQGGKGKNKRGNETKFEKDGEGIHVFTLVYKGRRVWKRQHGVRGGGRQKKRSAGHKKKNGQKQQANLTQTSATSSHRKRGTKTRERKEGTVEPTRNKREKENRMPKPDRTSDVQKQPVATIWDNYKQHGTTDKP